MAVIPPPEHDVFAPNGFVRAELLEPAAEKALQRAVCWAADTRWDSVRTPHLFMGLLSAGDRRVFDWCRLIGADADSLLLQFGVLFTRTRDVKKPLVRLNREFFSENAIRVLRTAHERTRRYERDLIGVSDLLIALFAPNGSIVAGCFENAGLPSERLAAMAIAAEERQVEPESR